MGEILVKMGWLSPLYFVCIIYISIPFLIKLLPWIYSSFSSEWTAYVKYYNLLLYISKIIVTYQSQGWVWSADWTPCIQNIEYCLVKRFMKRKLLFPVEPNSGSGSGDSWWEMCQQLGQFQIISNRVMKIEISFELLLKHIVKLKLHEL